MILLKNTKCQYFDTLCFYSLIYYKMVLQSNGEISLLDLQNEFGGSNPINLDEYYQNINNGYTNGVSGIPNNGNALSLNNFYGKNKIVSIKENNVLVDPINITNNIYYYMFTSPSSNYTFTCTTNVSCDVFLIGGGGGGAHNFGGGGGSGACIVGIGYTLSANTYNIIVGAGGNPVSNGGDSRIDSLFVAKGGGGGNISNTSVKRNGFAGGCGGGGGGYAAGTGGGTVSTNVVNGVSSGPATTTTYAVLGRIGGNAALWGNNYANLDSGGGGGIGAQGGNAASSIPGAGGNGIYQVTINGTVYNLKNYFSPNTSFGVNNGNNNFYIGGGGAAMGATGTSTGSTSARSGGLGGGGGASHQRTQLAFVGGDGVSNTGSGGGGGGTWSPSRGGYGGSGIVIIRFTYPML
jgi:hypothetical protein